MHARQLAEIGGWLATSAETFIHGEDVQPARNVSTYWSGSKCRLQRWHAALKVFANDLDNPSEMHDPWPAIRVVAEEILLSDVLTRIWSALLTEHDRVRRCNELHSIAHSIYIGHMEARNRTLRLLLQDDDASQKAIGEIDRVRRQLERWTDLLLSYVPATTYVARFGYDRSRIYDFANDRPLVGSRLRRQQSHVMLASFAACLRTETGRFPANPDLNRRIASGVLSCFPSNRFDSSGLPKSMWLLKMEQIHQDTQVMLDDLIDEDNEQPSGPRIWPFSKDTGPAHDKTDAPHDRNPPHSPDYWRR